MKTGRNKKPLADRARHLGWSLLIALAFWFTNLVGPIDQFVWTIQARLADFDASGDIVFVGSEYDLSDSNVPARRRQLALAISRLKDSGAAGVYVDEVFDEPSTPAVDGELNRVLRDFGPDAFLVRNLTSRLGGGVGFDRSIARVARGVPELGVHRYRGYLGYIWYSPTVVEHRGESLPGIVPSLAGKPDPGISSIPINYGFDLATIPHYTLKELLTEPDAALLDRLQGKKVIIGNISSDLPVHVPGFTNTPAGLVHIFAAETLKAGHTSSISGIVTLLMAAAILGLAALFRAPANRAILAAATAGAIPLAIVLTAQLAIRASIGGALVLVTAYALFRLRAFWKRRLLLVDQDTGLPTFATLEADGQVAAASPAIVVARLHRFEDVRKTLPPEMHGEYILRITDRLRGVSPDTKIYLGPGHLLAWCIPESDVSTLRDHLEGLRALFASPLQVGEQQVDVGLTFGMELSSRPDVAKRLANAVAAAETTNETYEPIRLAEIDSEEDQLWSISLQARIDRALANGEIFLAFQPKVLIASGEMIGAEALVRWRDPTRGMIPPDRFINQCEQTGRIAHLTRHVLTHACLAGNRLAEEGRPATMSVNISAIMLQDRAIVKMVTQSLRETGFDPHWLILEITETSRISDFAVAASILEQLRSLGLSISMDDFGVGAASHEALLHLPFSEIKIDRLFVSRIMEDPRSLGIVRSVLTLGRDLQATVVAEGVEDAATLARLREAGCAVAQGYGICRPVPLDELVHFRDGSIERYAKLSI